MSTVSAGPEPFSAEHLVRAAVTASGLQDFGEPPLEPALTILTKALASEARLSPAGLESRRAGLLRILANRLRIQEALTRTPQIADEKIEGPIVIVGLPRSGTTKLQRMIACDRSIQSLPLWRILDPIEDGTAAGRERRIAGAERFVAQLAANNPAFQAAHPMNAREADEEVFLMELSLQSNTNVHSAEVPSYKRWMKEQSFDGWYRFLRTLLQLYQHQANGTGRHWLLKAPFHLGHLPELFERFPDATIVHCHRDPHVAVPSMLALFEESRRNLSDHVDPLEVGETVMEIWTGLMKAYMRDRPRLEASHRFIDLPYRRLLHHAKDEIAEIYRMTGLELSADALAAMDDWESQNAQHKHGRHRYSLERYGVTPADIDSAFGDYMARFSSEIAC